MGKWRAGVALAGKVSLGRDWSFSGERLESLPRGNLFAQASRRWYSGE
ncbi:hypothetical protein [Porphyromonas levii]|nr:hypothetical protein [Porphyromonas levii]